VENGRVKKENCIHQFSILLALAVGDAGRLVQSCCVTQQDKKIAENVLACTLLTL